MTSLMAFFECEPVDGFVDLFVGFVFDHCASVHDVEDFFFGV